MKVAAATGGRASEERKGSHANFGKGSPFAECTFMVPHIDIY